MDRFVQFHLLTSYPPANLNRDDLGRPKTAIMGGVQRLRVSSQSLKRAWRTSDVFNAALSAHLGTRTKLIGVEIFEKLVQKDVSGKDAFEWSKTIASVFGKTKSGEKSKKDKDANLKEDLKALEIEQLAHFSPDELSAINQLINKLASAKKAPSEEDLALLKEKNTAVDIALFGRMLAANPRYNMEAAAQVSHAITVHRVNVEDDFFTAVDDLNTGEDDSGAGHIGETEFGAGLFYLYVCVDRQQLVDNLEGNGDLAKKTLVALAEAVSTVSPSGKQASFGSRARASFILTERGSQQPRSLSVAFLKPVAHGDMLSESILRLEATLDNMDKVYGPCAEARCSANATTGSGSLRDVIECVTGGL